MIYKQATTAAERIFRHSGSEIPVDVVAIAECLGIDVYAYPLPRGLSGILSTIDGRWCIGVQSRESRARQRFSIAHEIAHYLFDARLSDRAHYLSAAVPATRSERRADCFAAALLMPASTIRPDMSAAQVARRCGVSMRAAEIRLQELGLSHPESVPSL